jgi:nucleoid DNA-binding protein
MHGTPCDRTAARKLKARLGRNPATGEQIKIPLLGVHCA